MLKVEQHEGGGIIRSPLLAQVDIRFVNTPSTDNSYPKVIPRTAHSLSRANVSESAIKVLETLLDAGFESYLVGGGVRDLLLGLHPKDFDVATAAEPEEVQELFRNAPSGRRGGRSPSCRIIGRRFRLAHVRYGRDIVEVATFRAGHDRGTENVDHQTSLNGRIVRDNVFGSLEEDAWRRDFSVNCLYYDIRDESVLDFVGGMADLESRSLRLIGDPEQRYREDPVRMLRAIRLAAKLGFEIETTSSAPIVELAPLLGDISPARLFDESLKLFMTGHARAVFELLVHYDTFQELFPETARFVEGESAKRFITQALENTDKRLAEDKSVTPGFLLAAFLWPPLRQISREYQVQGMSEFEAIELAATEVVRIQCERVSFPRRFSLMAKEMWVMQPRLEQRHTRKPKQLLEHQRFRAAYDFLALRYEAGEEALKERVGFWTNIQELPGNKSDKSGGERPAQKRSRKGRRQRRPAPA